VPGAPAHHREHGFANTNPDYVRASRLVRLRYFVGRMLGTTFAPKHLDLPRVDNDGRALAANTTDATITWVGHSTLLVQLDGVNVLIDPQWSERASPVSFAGPRRMTPPGLDFDRLPPIHVVLVSHDHYDHLDVATVRRLAEHHHPRFVVPLGFRAWFADLGIGDVHELDWWGRHVERGLTFTCVPAQHFSARTPFDRDRTLWCGYVVRVDGVTIYFAGDSGYAPHFAEIGARFPSIDVALLPIGAYEPRWFMSPVHMNPDDAVRAHRDLRPRLSLGMHFGTFQLTDEAIDEPIHALERARATHGVSAEAFRVLDFGESLVAGK